MRRIGTNEDVIRAYLTGSGDEGKSHSGNLYFEGEILYSYGRHFPLAVDLGDFYVLNGDRASRTTSSKHQAPLFRLVPMRSRVEIPYSALYEMFRDKGEVIWNSGDVAEKLYDLEIIARESDWYFDTGRVDRYGDPIMDHVLGGVLFKYKGSTFVTGMDKSGSDPRGMFFLTELDNEQILKYGEPETVAEALELMKPDEVKIAEKEGLTVYRQGELFFVEDEIVNEMMVGADLEYLEKKYHIKHDRKEDSSHYATEGFEIDFKREAIQLVRGVIRHARGEHRILRLYEEGTKVKDRKWFVVYDSPQGTSWKASGEVD